MFDKALQASCFGDEGVLRIMLTIFVDETPKRRQLLQRSLENEDAAGTAKIAHVIAGAAGMMHVDELLTLARALEATCKQRHPAMPDLARRLDNVLADVAQAAEQRLAA